MLSPEALVAWTRTHHGPRAQARVISYISSKLDELDGFGGYSADVSLHQVVVMCHEEHTPNVPLTTICCWWEEYLEWGELPWVMTKRKAKLRKKMLLMSSRAAINDHELMQLKDIVDENPQLYLDKIALSFAMVTSKYLCCSTIHEYLTTKLLDYSLRVLSAVAKQREEEEEEASFLNALNIIL